MKCIAGLSGNVCGISFIVLGYVVWGMGERNGPGYCNRCEITIYDIPYSGSNGNGYLNPERCPKCGGWLD